MKNNTIKYLIALAVVAVLAVIFSALRMGGTGGGEVATTSPQEASSSAPVPASAPAAASPARPATKALAPVPTNASYKDYLTQLRAGESACKDAASVQYNKIYAPGFESSSFASYFNSTNGLCYMQVTGQARPAYATTTIGHMYFRNVSSSATIAECVDPTGIMYADANWSCKNDLTGQPMNIAQFKTLNSTYVPK